MGEHCAKLAVRPPARPGAVVSEAAGPAGAAVRSPPGGVPLDAATRGLLEPRFGIDFSTVRVHTDAAARQSAVGMRARAFTWGEHIVFAAPGPTRWLLAHELAHVGQQRLSAPRPGRGSRADEHERHADGVADVVVRGGDASGLLRQAPAGPAAVQLAPEDQADSPLQLRLPPKGINPEVELPRSPGEEASLSAAVSRKVITFILGPDSDRFYKAAHEYWRQPGRTNVLVTDQRTLTDVIAYLNAHPPQNGRSWAQVNLVTHANEEGGLGFKFSSKSPNNLSPAELGDRIKAGAIPKVDGSVVDFHTDINVHGCAIGRNPAMLAELSQAIGGGQSDVYAPKDLQAYKYSGRGASERTEEYLVEYWSVGHPAGEARTNKQLVAEFDGKYGTVPGLDWSKAIVKAKTMTMPYHYNFEAMNVTSVPRKDDRAGHAQLLRTQPAAADFVQWSVASQSTVAVGDGNETTTIVYDTKVRDDTGQLVDGTFTLPLTNPVIPADTDAARHAWLEARIGADEMARFSWRFSTTQRPRVGQSGSVTVIAEGRRTVVRIERDLKDAKGANVDPSRDDPAHYGHVTPAEVAKRAQGAPNRAPVAP